MGKRSDGAKYWRDLRSVQFWLFTAVVNVILLVIWFGVNKLIAFMPIIRDIGYLVLLVAGVFAAAVYLPRVTPQHVQGKMADGGTKPKNPSRIEHDGVLWEDGGTYFGGGVIVNGPLCPKDFTPLSTEIGEYIQGELKPGKLISNLPGHRYLFCSECKSKYTLGEEPKTVNDSENEVRNRFEGKRRREQKK